MGILKIKIPTRIVFNIENSNGNTIYIDYVKDMETLPIRLAEIDNFGRIIYSNDAISQGIHYTISFTNANQLTLTKVVENTPTPTDAGDNSFECEMEKLQNGNCLMVIHVIQVKQH